MPVCLESKEGCEEWADHDYDKIRGSYLWLTGKSEMIIQSINAMWESAIFDALICSSVYPFFSIACLFSSQERGTTKILLQLLCF